MRRYVEAAVDSEIQTLRRTSSGRACAAFRAAAAIGGFVVAGEVDRSDVERALLAAALETGLPEREAVGHIRRGIIRGETTPRDVPAPSVCYGLRRLASHFGNPAVPGRSQVEAPPARPPIAEVQQLWDASFPVGSDAHSAAWFARRYGSTAPWFIQQAEFWDLARVIPPDLRLPRWAWSRGGPWTHTAHRIIFRLWDHTGGAVSLRARSIDGTAAPKSLAPSGFSVKGLVLADPLASQLLGGICPAWWQPREIVVAEGEPDWLLWAARQPETEAQGPACFGIEAGSWSSQIADRIPSGARLAIRSHHDEPGERYAQQIATSLRGRCRIFRSSVGEEASR